jgi:hypothetical protein
MKKVALTQENLAVSDGNHICRNLKWSIINRIPRSHPKRARKISTLPQILLSLLFEWDRRTLS